MPKIYLFHLNSCHQTRFIVDIPHSNSQPLTVFAFRVFRCICSNLRDVKALLDLFMGDTNLCYDTLHAPPSWQLPSLLFIGS